jgi:hypothetical protein
MLSREQYQNHGGKYLKVISWLKIKSLVNLWYFCGVDLLTKNLAPCKGPNEAVLIEDISCAIR